MKIAILGGSGKMGRWFARLLLQEGFEVILTGRDKEKLLEAQRQLGNVDTASNIEAVKNADIIVLSVSIDSFEPVVREIAPYVRPDQSVLDITSVKVMPVDVMHRYLKDALILGTHPVFGPGAKDLNGHNVVLTPTTEKEQTLALKVQNYLTARGSKVSLMTPAEHDKMMAVVLGLSHFIAIVSADALLSLDNLAQTRQIGGITYKALLTLVESVLSEDPNLYAAIQMNLPDLPRIESIFMERVQIWADFVKNRDRESFVTRMSELKRRLEKDADFGRAYENMYRLAGGM
jgi:prephenate dehydrogenase